MDYSELGETTRRKFNEISLRLGIDVFLRRTIDGRTVLHVDGVVR